jgi:hypothetical protein
MRKLLARRVRHVTALPAKEVAAGAKKPRTAGTTSSTAEIQLVNFMLRYEKQDVRLVNEGRERAQRLFWILKT